MKFSRLALFGLFLASGLLHPAPGFAQTTEAEPDLARAREFLALDEARLKTEVEKLNVDEAIELSTQIRFLARPQNPQIDRLAVVLQHLETLRATDLAQRRLDQLLLVLACVLALFAVFLMYVVIDQRRTVRALQSLLANDQSAAAETARAPIYRGD